VRRIVLSYQIRHARRTGHGSDGAFPSGHVRECREAVVALKGNGSQQRFIWNQLWRRVGKLCHNNAMMKLVIALVIALVLAAFGALAWEIWIIHLGP
jgi:hypothetical protein